MFCNGIVQCTDLVIHVITNWLFADSFTSQRPLSVTINCWQSLDRFVSGLMWWFLNEINLGILTSILQLHSLFRSVVLYVVNSPRIFGPGIGIVFPNYGLLLFKILTLYLPCLTLYQGQGRKDTKDFFVSNKKNYYRSFKIKGKRR